MIYQVLQELVFDWCFRNDQAYALVRGVLSGRVPKVTRLHFLVEQEYRSQAIL
jgi:hypothetical protein